jgi:hypothetical protein
VLQMEKSKQSMWVGWGRVALLRKGESPVLQARQGKKRWGHGGCRWSLPAERACFSFSGAFKTYTTPWEGRPRRFPPNNEWVGRGMDSPQAGEDGLAHPQATYKGPKLFLLLACLTWEANYQGHTCSSAKQTWEHTVTYNNSPTPMRKA